ncbi:hypothetical protein [Nesterenkonia suensis]
MMSEVDDVPLPYHAAAQVRALDKYHPGNDVKAYNAYVSGFLSGARLALSEPINAEQIEKATEAHIPWETDEYNSYPDGYHPRAVRHARDYVTMLFRSAGLRVEEGDEWPTS